MIAAFVRLSEHVAVPAYQSDGAVAFDLQSAQDVTIAPRQHALIGTGLIVVPPEGYHLILAARSSTFIKKRLVLANGIGVIDEDYVGPDDELKLCFINLSDEPVNVSRGERIAQAMFAPTTRFEFIGIGRSQLQKSRGGFGSTGGYKVTSS